MGIANYRIILGLPQLPEGVPPELFNQFFIIYQAINNLLRQISQFAGIDAQDSTIWDQLSVDDTIWQIVPTRWYARQNEALNFGDAVSAFLSSGELQVRKANATDNTRPCIGFVTSQDHTSSIGSFCEVTASVGLITGISGMTAGTRYFLSTSAGLITSTAPVAAGNIEQVVGIALASNRLLVNINMAWVQH
jgi:hypothetical protein